MRDRRLAEREVIGDVADADRFFTGGQEVEDADAGRIGQGLEPGGVGLGIRLGDGRRAGRGAAGSRVRRGDRSIVAVALALAATCLVSFAGSIERKLISVNILIDRGR